jgi:hypothetical protein
MKTVEEIRKRYAEDDDQDMFGFGKQVFGDYLVECYKDEHKDKVRELNQEEMQKELIDYLGFAFGKAIDHRGLSAMRSVIKLSNWAWMLERQELHDFARADGNYSCYGVPILKRFAQAFDVPIPEEIAKWEDGKPCKPDCDGCTS